MEIESTSEDMGIPNMPLFLEIFPDMLYGGTRYFYLTGKFLRCF
jgi:hypothetical protein